MAEAQERYVGGAWGPRSIIVWGGNWPGLYHLPGTLAAYGASVGAHLACREGTRRDEVGPTWTRTFGLGFARRPCRSCFTRTGRPRRKWMPEGGWLRLPMQQKRTSDA